jgi:hypothetical protein
MALLTAADTGPGAAERGKAGRSTKCAPPGASAGYCVGWAGGSAATTV